MEHSSIALYSLTLGRYLNADILRRPQIAEVKRLKLVVILHTADKGESHYVQCSVSVQSARLDTERQRQLSLPHQGRPFAIADLQLREVSQNHTEISMSPAWRS